MDRRHAGGVEQDGSLSARVRATPDQLRELVRLAGQSLELAERMEVAAGAGAGYPGPCPAGVPWERWLANNNVD